MCVAVDNKGNVFASGDGGTTWSQQLALGTDLTSVSCASSSLCVTVDTAGNVTAFAPPLFLLTVFITGQGEVTLTPAGIPCSSEECSYEFAGEVTLTLAKAGAGYEFAGWIGSWSGALKAAGVQANTTPPWARTTHGRGLRLS